MIERLSKSQIQDILSLQESAGFFDGWTESMLASAFENRYFAFGVYIEKQLIAFIGVDEGLFEYEIESVLVSPSHRKMGYAKRLLNHVLDLAKKGGKESVLLEVRKNNVCALGLYLGAGFEQIALRKAYYPDGEDAVVLRKEI